MRKRPSNHRTYGKIDCFWLTSCHSSVAQALGETKKDTITGQQQQKCLFEIKSAVIEFLRRIIFSPTLDLSRTHTLYLVRRAFGRGYVRSEYSYSLNNTYYCWRYIRW